mmetsp:Transcript_82718/g.229580  ORF Transcript_82718/g.229580 Transcript_82718/m.229580 type:complete len:246 (-) Transcript_82718:210-947(-)
MGGAAPGWAGVGRLRPLPPATVARPTAAASLGVAAQGVEFSASWGTLACLAASWTKAEGFFTVANLASRSSRISSARSGSKLRSVVDVRTSMPLPWAFNATSLAVTLAAAARFVLEVELLAAAGPVPMAGLLAAAGPAPDARPFPATGPLPAAAPLPKAELLTAAGLLTAARPAPEPGPNMGARPCAGGWTSTAWVICAIAAASRTASSASSSSSSASGSLAPSSSTATPSIDSALASCATAVTP